MVERGVAYFMAKIPLLVPLSYPKMTAKGNE